MDKDNRQNDLQISDNDTAVDMLHKMYVAKYVKIHSDGSLIFEYPADGSINIERFVNFVSRFNALHPYIVQVLKDERFNKVKISEVLANCNDECLPIYTDINDDKFAKDPVKHTVMLSAKVLYIARVCPYINDELTDAEKIKHYRGLTLSEVVSNTDADKKGRVFAIDPAKEKEAAALSEAYKAYIHAGKVMRINAARQSQQAKHINAVQDAKKKTSYNTGKDMFYPTTKLSNEFFIYDPPVQEIAGQLYMELPYIGDNKATLYCYYNGNDVHFDDYDFFINATFNNLYLEGNKEVSFTKALNELGVEPTEKNFAELRARLLKGMGTIIHICNKEILEAYKIDTKDYKDIDSPVLPVKIEKKTSRARGNVMKHTIKILDQSPFFEVAEPIKQFTTVDKRMLQLYPGRRTKRYWQVLRYLSKEINWMRYGNRSDVILMQSVFDYVGDKRTEHRAQSKKLVIDLLDTVFKKIGYVKDYSIDDTTGSITIKCNKEPKKVDKPQNQK